MNENRIVLKGTNKRDAAAFLLFVFLLPYVCACLWGHVGEETEALRQEKGREEAAQRQGCRMQIAMDWGVWEIPMEEYLVYKLASVMPDSYEPEALKAQAVLLRTEVVQALGEQESDALQTAGEGIRRWYDAKEQEKEKLSPYGQAVEETGGLYLCYRGEPVQASYFPLSNGQTRNAKEVWNTKQCPYLTSVSCPQDKAAPDYESEVIVSKAGFVYEIQPLVGMEDSPQELWEDIRYTYDDAGYVTKVSFYAEGEEAGEIDGETFRYLFALPSAAFEVKQESSQMIFHVKGVGHGFGMSQYSADSRAVNGETYREILAFFFPGTELAKIE